MAYKVLYRKYRPSSFNKIVGQDTIVENLKNSVKEGSFSHAYIFTGPRGTGKTSTAKVLAKSLVCMKPKDGEPCEQCENCKNFATLPDIIEIDAASNNGVNEIRELRNNVTLAPATARYKIYIIDEVHMLTDGAFNALLKTLEEPPAHTIFILATTEIYKVPITILSRCQRYDFKKIEKSKMIRHLKDICEQEKILYEEGVLDEIYELSEGCLRDALSILDQSSKTEKKLTISGLLKNYNMISSNSINELLEFVKNGEVDSIVNKIEEYENLGINPQKLLKRMINRLEKIAIDIKLGKTRDFDFNLISSLIDSLNKCYIDARINENVFTIIKLCFLEITKSEPCRKPKETSDQSRQNLTKVNENDNASKVDEKPTAESKKSLTDIRINNCFVDVNKEALNILTEKWKDLDGNKVSLKIEEYKPVAASNTYAIFSTEEESLVNLFNMKCEEIEKILKRENLPIKVISITQEKWQQEKIKYKNNMVKKVKYEYLEEPKQKEKNSKIKKEAEELFTENIVEVS